MSCEHLQPDYGAFVLGTLEGPVREEIQAHLVRHCATCVGGISREQVLMAQFAYLAPQIDPPAHVRSQILRAVAQAAPRHLSFWESAFWRMAFPVTGIAAIALLAITVGLSIEVRSLNGELRALKAEEERAKEREKNFTALIRQYRDAMLLMTSPGVRDIRFGPRKAEPKGRLFLQANGAVLVASDLPKAPSGRVLQLWLISRKQPTEPIPAGVFEAADGSAVHVFSGDVAVRDVVAAAVSDEPPGGLPAPTGKVTVVWKAF